MQIDRNVFSVKSLLNLWIGWSFAGTWLTSTMPRETFLRTKNRSSSTWFIFPCWTELNAIEITLVLSHYMIGTLDHRMRSSVSIDLTHKISHMVIASPRNSTLVVEHEITLCFLKNKWWLDCHPRKGNDYFYILYHLYFHLNQNLWSLLIKR